MFEFINQNSGFFLVLFSFIVAISTLIYAILTVKLVKETRKMRVTQTEPNIFISLRSKEEYIGLVDLVIENIGSGAAYDIKFDISPDFELRKGKKLSEVRFIKKGLRYLSPNNKIKFFLTTLYGRAEELKKLLIKVKVKYKNLEGKLYKHEYILDFSELLDIRRAGEPSVKKIANNLEKIQRDINKLLFSSFHKIKVIRYTKEDIENEEREILEEERKFEEKQQKKKTK